MTAIAVAMQACAAGGYALQLVADSVTAIGGQPSVTFARAGTISGVAIGPIQTYWVVPQSGNPGDQYEIRVTKTSGGNLSGASLGTWLPLSTSRTWNGPSVIGTTNFTVEIGLLGTSTAILNKAWSMTWS